MLITVFGKSDFTTPFALRCCVIWAFPHPSAKGSRLTPRGSTDPVPQDPTVPAGKGRLRHPRKLSRLSIQSKIMLMLLVSSLASLAVIGVVGYVSGRNTLTARRRRTNDRAA